MRNRIVSSMTVLAAMIAFSSFALAQAGHPATPAKTDSKAQPYDPHDLTGVWDTAAYLQPKGEVNPLALNHAPTPLPPFTPAGEARYNTNVKFNDAGAVLDCDPFGTARNFFTPRPFEVIASRDRLLQHFEYYDNWREIWTDGRKMPDDLEPDYMGYSIGKWEGNTFVVESANYNGKQFLTWTGLPLSESMHQTERWERVDHDTLRILFTFDDPKMYAKPWTITYYYKLKPNWVLDAHPCVLSEIKEYDERLNHADKLPGRDYKPEK